MEEHAGQPAGLRSKLNAHQLDLLVRKLESLPALPAVVARALELAGPCAGEAGAAPRDADALVEVIRCDAAMTAKVLSLAGVGRAVAAPSVAEAVRILRPDAIRAAVLSVRVLDSPAADRAENGMDYAGFWRHCLAVAWGAKLLAERAGLPMDGDAVFTAGLLHDVGKLVLAAAVPKSYSRALASARAENATLNDHERRLLGVDHTIAGRRLAQHWRLPASAQNVIWLHHQPPEAIPASVGAPDLIRLVALADSIARRTGIGFSGNCSSGPSPEALTRRLGLAPTVIDEVAERVSQAVENSVRLFELGPRDAEPGCRETLTAAKEELGRLNEQLWRRSEASAVQAGAYRLFRELASNLTGEAEVVDVLDQIARTFADAIDSRPTGPHGAVVAYCLDERHTSILAVRREPEQLAEWCSFDLSASEGRQLASGGGSETIGRAVREAERWRHWMGPAELAHCRLACGGRWLGGVYYPPGEGQEIFQALADALGLLLGLVRRRVGAETLSEEIAGAAQRQAEAVEDLSEAKALTVIEDIAAGAAHELNNPLAVISGRAQVMRDRSRSKKQRETWQTIADQAQRISDIISELMAFARPPEPQPAQIAPAELLSAAAESFSRSDHPQAGASRVDIEIGEDVPVVRADQIQLEAVLVELMTNAATAASSVPRIRLSAKADELDDAVVLTVRDEGPGMDERTVSRACTPFFSAQSAGRRHGLGLPRAKRYVENNGGRLRIDSKPGKGTTVLIRLPGVRSGNGAGEQCDE